MKKAAIMFTFFFLLTSVCRADIFKTKEGIKFELPTGWRMGAKTQSKTRRQTAYRFYNKKNADREGFIIALVTLKMRKRRKLFYTDNELKNLLYYRKKVNVKNAARAEILYRKGVREPRQMHILHNNGKWGYKILLRPYITNDKAEKQKFWKTIRSVELF